MSSMTGIGSSLREVRSHPWFRSKNLSPFGLDSKISIFNHRFQTPLLGNGALMMPSQLIQPTKCNSSDLTPTSKLALSRGQGLNQNARFLLRFFYRKRSLLRTILPLGVGHTIQNAPSSMGFQRPALTSVCITLSPVLYGIRFQLRKV